MPRKAVDPGPGRETRPPGASERELLLGGAHQLGVDLSSSAIADCVRFLDLLCIWNARANLVGDQARGRLIQRHLLDSLAVVQLVARLGTEPSIVDVGSGAGFPGVPVAIALPRAAVTLVESRRKRANFLRRLSRELPHLRLTVLEARVEDLIETRIFDGAVSRAAYSAGQLLGLVAPLVRPGGLVAVHRGRQPLTSRSVDKGPERRVSGFGPPTTVQYRLPGERFSRELLWATREVGN